MKKNSFNFNLDDIKHKPEPEIKYKKVQKLESALE